MSETQTSICNMALAKAGVNVSISAITDATEAARKCKLFYDSTLTSLLEASQWGFARTASALALNKALPGTDENTAAATTWLSTLPQPPWNYEYAYPKDCITLWYVVPQGQYVSLVNTANTLGLWPLWRTVAVPFEVGAGDGDLKVVMTNAQGAIAIYNRNISNPGLWPAQFQQAMVAMLAFHLSIPLGGDKQLMQANAQTAERLLTEAATNDGNEGISRVDYTPEVLQAREASPFFTDIYGNWR